MKCLRRVRCIPICYRLFDILCRGPWRAPNLCPCLLPWWCRTAQHVGEGVLVHTRPRVSHGQLDVWSTASIGVRVHEALIQLYIRRLYAQPAPVRHGVTGVDGKIHDHLLYVRGVCLHRPQGGAGPADELYLVSANVLEKLGHGEECRQMARILAERLNRSRAPFAVMLPTQGW